MCNMVRVATHQDELNFLTFHLSLTMHSESFGGGDNNNNNNNNKALIYGYFNILF